ncbi:hypothetical protein PCANC_11219 [Puccinia coronata f. sp. avenae]|uniref:Uncharacterized protein n=1 Tax=Puccinia coronata f. sp. avenae TaxID=200324 RepID=A0A2N5V8L8_9BASI|nr:hypothetical protein PCANC_11219 [Puccinia coronata f. sp. avenae]PLW50714.1 hypothetical protein PCASD_00637 [Puccinia coronata f. sp. avenae]
MESLPALIALQDVMCQLITPRRRNPSSEKLIKRLVADVWAVRLGLRSACLLDGVAINEEMAIQIADGMKDITCLANLVVFHERLSSSTFICSRSLWKTREEPTGRAICIDLSSTPAKILDQIPGPVQRVLETCAASDQLQASNRMIVELQPASTMICLAGLFLGYPCTYWNCSTNQLVSGPLKVVQVNLFQLTPSAEEVPILPPRHQLMAFSFPAAFDYPGSSLESSKLIHHLKHQIQEKMRGAGCSYGWREVEIHVAQNLNIERVAL